MIVPMSAKPETSVAADAAPPNFQVRPFRPAWWLPGGHGQTLGARWLRRRLRVPFHRQRIETRDGDFIDLDYARPVAVRTAPDRASATHDCVAPRPEETCVPLVLILHGLEGCSRSGYVTSACLALAESGIQTVAMNFRSRSGEPNRRPESYHAGRSDDLAFVLDALSRERPETPLGVIGFSLGGNVLLKYLGENGPEARNRLRAAVAISIPFDLAASTCRMEDGFGSVYAGHFLRSLRRAAAEKAMRFPHAVDWDRATAARTLRQFDDAVTAPVHGFRDADHYYSEASSAAFVERIRVPTLLLQARDDPLVPWSSVPSAPIHANPWLADGATRRGGHVGFIGGASPWNPTFWADREASRFLVYHLMTRRAYFRESR